MAAAIDILLSLAVPALVLLHLLVAPYTKVEESFNIQAIHDILTYGVPSPLGSDPVDFIRSNYDHATFPGSVPRTFVGASFLAGIARPLVGFLSSPQQVQTLVRAILGLVNAAALVRFRTAVDVAYGKTAGRFYLAFVACQFQLIFYASRTLPNYLALPLTTEASRALLLALSTSPKLRPSSRRRRLGLYLLAVAGIVFRSEVALLLATSAVTLFLFSGLKVRSELVPALFAGALVGLPLTLGLDTFLWRPKIALSLTYQVGSSSWHISIPTWPEMQAFLYNTVQGHSSEWGTSPFHYYFTTALPKLLLNPVHLLLVPLSFAIPATRRTSITSLLPSLAFIALFSALPHKEPRFIIYTLPILLASSAAAASYIFTRRHKSPLFRLLTPLLLLSLPLALLLSTATLHISSLNYPGAHALATLHAMARPGNTLATTMIPDTGTHPALSPAQASRALASAAVARHALAAHKSKGHVKVHIDDLAAQTGVTRFQELHRPRLPAGYPEPLATQTQRIPLRWIYDKTADGPRLRSVSFWDDVDFAITEAPEKVPGAWEVVADVWAFDGVGLRLKDQGQEEEGAVHSLAETERVLFFPEVAGENIGAWVEGVARAVARRSGGWWPHVRLRKRLYVLQKGKMGL